MQKKITFKEWMTVLFITLESAALLESMGDKPFAAGVMWPNFS